MKILNSTLILALAVLSIVSCSSSKQAQTNTNDSPQKNQGRMPHNGNKPNIDTLFSMLDKNNDNKISFEEAKNAKRGPLKENFSSLDKDNDGFITKDEFKSHRPNKRG